MGNVPLGCGQLQGQGAWFSSSPTRSCDGRFDRALPGARVPFVVGVAASVGVKDTLQDEI